MNGLRITAKRLRTSNTTAVSPMNTKKPSIVISSENNYSEPTNSSSFSSKVLTPDENVYRSTITQSANAIRKSGLKDSEISNEILNEIIVYKTLQAEHGRNIPYIMPFRDSSFNKEQEQTSPSSFIYFNMDKLNGADLIRFPNIQTSPEKYQIAMNAAIALQWLADQGFTHGDIKLDNLFREENGNIRLLDLGLSQSFRKDRIKMFGSFVRRADKWSAIHDMDAFIDNVIDKMAISLPEPLRDSRKYLEDTLRESDYENPPVALHNFYQGIIDFCKTQKARGGRRRKTRRKYRRHH